MKNKNYLFAILIFALFLIAGCGASPMPYSFADKETDTAGTAVIKFEGTRSKIGVDLHFFEDKELPIPNRRGLTGGHYWSPVFFPAGRPFKLTVNVYYDTGDVGTEHIFNCPALSAGRTYKLSAERKKGFLGIVTSPAMLILKDTKTRKTVYEQPF